MVMGAQRARTLTPPQSASAPAGPAQACAERLDQLGPALALFGMTAASDLDQAAARIAHVLATADQD